VKGDFLTEALEIIERTKTHVQGSVFVSLYSTVHGVSDAIDYGEVFKTEINSATDNPNIFIESDTISGGIFMGNF
jgi:histidine ammonia-lyase